MPCPLLCTATAMADTQVVRWFWEVSHSLSEARKKQLLFFVTGSDRVPIKVSNLPSNCLVVLTESVGGVGSVKGVGGLNLNSTGISASR